jgi:L,D-peptidoglycan transpeptidase YkuD (ErfK/YbiS/YcfS/YnhG family)
MHEKLPKIIGLVMLGMLLTSCAALKPPESRPAPLQAVVVTTANWDRADGMLRGYARKNGEAPWERALEQIPVVVGRNGMGWGRGMHPLPLPEGPVKQEGDGKAPAGIFRLSSAFGYVSEGEAAWITMPYRQATAQLLCIDDTRSVHYNRIVDKTRIEADWQDHEKMRRRDDLYRFGIVVDHNMDPTIAGRGSCIFMHIWRGPSKGTAGCTAMAAQHLENLLLWLNPASMPILIQLPDAEYERLQTPWRLP